MFGLNIAYIKCMTLYLYKSPQRHRGTETENSVPLCLNGGIIFAFAFTSEKFAAKVDRFAVIKGTKCVKMGLLCIPSASFHTQP